MYAMLLKTSQGVLLYKRCDTISLNLFVVKIFQKLLADLKSPKRARIMDNLDSSREHREQKLSRLQNSMMKQDFLEVEVPFNDQLRT